MKKMDMEILLCILLVKKKNNENTIHLLFKYNANVNVRNINDNTPLHFAALNNKNVQLWYSFFKQNENANIYAINKHENSLLHLLCFNNDG